VLASELRELETDGTDLALIGSATKNWSATRRRRRTSEDVADEVPKRQPASNQPGDVWLIGAHRLICGDCREGISFARYSPMRWPTWS